MLYGLYREVFNALRKVCKLTLSESRQHCARVGRMARAHWPRRQICRVATRTFWSSLNAQRPVPLPLLTHLPSNPRIPSHLNNVANRHAK
jgi:hypothetical protein